MKTNNFGNALDKDSLRAMPIADYLVILNMYANTNYGNTKLEAIDSFKNGAQTEIGAIKKIMTIYEHVETVGDINELFENKILPYSLVRNFIQRKELSQHLLESVKQGYPQLKNLADARIGEIKERRKSLVEFYSVKK